MHLRLQFTVKQQEEMGISPPFISLAKVTRKATGFGEAALKKVKFLTQKWLGSGLSGGCCKV